MKEALAAAEEHAISNAKPPGAAPVTTNPGKGRSRHLSPPPSRPAVAPKRKVAAAEFSPPQAADGRSRFGGGLSERAGGPAALAAQYARRMTAAAAPDDGLGIQSMFAEGARAVEDGEIVP